MAILKVGVLISGRGSNLQALIDACAERSFPAEIVLVVSNVPGAAGLERARAAGVDAAVIDHRDFEDRADFERALTRALEAAGVTFVCCAGFMRVLTPTFVDRWRDRLVNIHPSLLPAFPGLDTHRRAIEAGVRFAGCTVHFVRAEVDQGPMIVQAAVAVRPGDDAASLAARVLEAEHVCYPRALRLIAEERARVRAETVEIDGAAAPGGVWINPDG